MRNDQKSVHWLCAAIVCTLYQRFALVVATWVLEKVIQATNWQQILQAPRTSKGLQGGL